MDGLICGYFPMDAWMHPDGIQGRPWPRQVVDSSHFASPSDLLPVSSPPYPRLEAQLCRSAALFCTSLPSLPYGLWAEGPAAELSTHPSCPTLLPTGSLPGPRASSRLSMCPSFALSYLMHLRGDWRCGKRDLLTLLSSSMGMTYTLNTQLLLLS